MFVVKLMFFFDVFINHFPKIHSVLRKIATDLLYCIFDTFMTSICEKKVRQKDGLLMQIKCLHIISSF